MEHNHEANDSGTGIGEDRWHNFTLDEAEVLFHARLLVPPEYKLPHGWHLSDAGDTVSPAPEGEELRALIMER
jgi:hypothetical protein